MQIAATRVKWCVSLINVLLISCQSFPVTVSINQLLTRQTRSSAYIYLLGLQHLISLPDRFVGCTFSQSNPHVQLNAPGRLYDTMLPESARSRPQTLRAMSNIGWPAHLAALSSLSPRTSPTLSLVTSLARWRHSESLGPLSTVLDALLRRTPTTRRRRAG